MAEERNAKERSWLFIFKIAKTYSFLQKVFRLKNTQKKP